MAKKIFFATIPLQPEGKLDKVIYKWGFDGNIDTNQTRFPIIPLIEENVSIGDEVKIVAVKTIDDKKNCDRNIIFLEEELKELSSFLNMDLKINHVIEIEHNENPKKQIWLLKQIAKQFDKKSKIYMDVTYGTKATSTCSFASLAYAEKIMDCEIATVLYGKYTHGMEKGELYNLKSLYELNMIVQSAQFLPKEDVKKFIDELWEE